MNSSSQEKGEWGSLDGHFLIAMPGLQEGSFGRSVIYICAHSASGAMGLIINRHQSVSFLDVLEHLDMVDKENGSLTPEHMRRVPVLMGGPVESGRGFVLHSNDYSGESTIPVADDICLTATLDVIRAISQGKGPTRAIMALGYSGWGPGQLEEEITNNGWLTCPASDDVIFDTALDTKYERALALLGISPEALSADAGHA